MVARLAAVMATPGSTRVQTIASVPASTCVSSWFDGGREEGRTEYVVGFFEVGEEAEADEGCYACAAGVSVVRVSVQGSSDVQDAEAQDDDNGDLGLLRHAHVPEHRNRNKRLRPSATPSPSLQHTQNPHIASR